MTNEKDEFIFSLFKFLGILSLNKKKNLKTHLVSLNNCLDQLPFTVLQVALLCLVIHPCKVGV